MVLCFPCIREASGLKFFLGGEADWLSSFHTPQRLGTKVNRHLLESGFAGGGVTLQQLHVHGLSRQNCGCLTDVCLSMLFLHMRIYPGVYAGQTFWVVSGLCTCAEKSCKVITLE